MTTVDFQTAYDLFIDERHYRHRCPVEHCDLHRGPNKLTTTQLIMHLQNSHTDLMLNNVMKDTERMLRILHKALQAKHLADKRLKQ